LSRRLKAGIKDGMYAILIFLLFLVTKPLFRLRVKGRANIDRNGTYIVVARHRSYWDIPVFAIALGGWNRVHFIARKGLMKGNLLAQVLVRTFATIIDRDNFSKSDFRKMRDAIERERLVGIFPEGTTRERVDAKAGAIHFASIVGKDLLPVNIRAEGPYPPRYPLGFPRLTVSIGEPFSVDDLSNGSAASVPRSERHQWLSDRLMERVDNA
jgi:1-acyl-sn-glycerol-3-phosphate acyltransferase